jgi:sphingomyelin phosphodiesterase
MDYDYVEGANAECGKPLCCRSDSGMTTDPTKMAGKWGDYRCDLNKRTFDTMMSFIKDDIKPDAVLWGGDSIPHNLDTLTFEDNVNIMKNVTSDVLNGLEGLKIYPTIGNHDTYP